MNTNKFNEYGAGASNVVLSTRVRLARDIDKYPFPGHMSPEQYGSVLDEVSGVMTGSGDDSGFALTTLDGTDRMQSASLTELHLISPEFAAASHPRGVVLSRDRRVSVMINEEDHIRIQALGYGLHLEECWKKADEVDTLLEKKLDYAFSEELGYLTRCPTNLGTGLRASVMLQLKALTETGDMQNVISAANKVGFAVRGLYGEGSSAKGAIYQISNQFTLGLSEAEIIQRLGAAVQNIIGMESRLHSHIIREQPLYLEDKAWRAAGILSTARMLGEDEAMELLSDLRLGVAIGEIKNVPVEDINRLIWEIQPASLNIKYGKNLSDRERQTNRALLARQVAKKALSDKAEG